MLNVENELKTEVIAWQPPYDYFDGTERFWDKYENKDYFFIYCVCLYYSVLVIGGNELGPRETSELVYVVMINLIGAIVNAYIFGELAVLLTQIDRKQARYQHVFDAANTAMSNINLDEKLKEEIRTYFKKVQDTMSQQRELNEFFDQISPSLKLEVQSHMFERSLQKNITIKKAADAIMEVKDARSLLKKKTKSGFVAAHLAPLFLHPCKKHILSILNSIVAASRESLCYSK